MSHLRYIAIASIMILFVNQLQAQSKTINVATTATPFLRISADAKGSGMASTAIATLPDFNAIFSNSAKLPFTESKGAISANYSPWLREWSGDMYVASLAGYYKIGENEAIHGQIKYFNPGALQFTDNNGNNLQAYQPYEFSFDLGYARKLSNRMGLGVTLKYIHSDLARGIQNGQDFKAGNAMAGDLSFFYDLRNTNEDGWSFGAVLSNLGSKISYSRNSDQKNFLPANVGLGTSYTKVFDERNRINVGLDINKLLVPTAPLGDSAGLITYKNKSVVGSWFSSFTDAPGGFSEELKEFQLSIGGEYWYNSQFALRAGYFFESKVKGDRRYFTAGAGVRYNLAIFNFSYLVPSGNGINRNPLANTLQFGATLDFKN
jgi:hypothetical protein